MSRLNFQPEEILETIRMVQMENLDIRTITMGISLRDCADADLETSATLAYDKICRLAARLVKVGEEIERDYGVPIINKRISVTPIAMVAERSDADDYTLMATYLDRAAREVGVNFIGGFSALVQKGYTRGDRALIASIPEALASTRSVCASVNVATTKAGINMDAVAQMGRVIKNTAEKTAAQGGIGCAKLVVFCNAVEDNPFMAGAFHGVGEPECVINVGVSGPGVVLRAIEQQPDADFGELASIIKRTAFKVTRMGELAGRVASAKLGVPFGIVDLSLAPTPAQGDSVARILEEMGLERVGTHGSTAAALRRPSVAGSWTLAGQRRPTTPRDVSPRSLSVSAVAWPVAGRRALSGQPLDNEGRAPRLWAFRRAAGQSCLASFATQPRVA